MKKLRFLAALIALATFASCELLDTAIDTNPGGFDQFFVDSYNNGLNLGASFKPADRLPQQPLLYAIVGAGLNSQYETFALTGAGTFTSQNYPQYGGMWVSIGGADTLPVLSDVDTLDRYFWFWKKESWLAAGSPIGDNYANAVQQASYTGDLKVGRVSLTEAQHALQVLATQHGKIYPADYYLSGFIIGKPDCIGYPQFVPQTRNALVKETYGILNECILSDNSGKIVALVVENASGVCRRIKAPGGASISLTAWDVSCNPYPDTALARITVRMFKNVPGGQINQALTGVWYRPDQKPNYPMFWMEGYFPSRWAEGRMILAPKPGSDWATINALLGLQPGEVIIGVTGYSTE